MKIEISRQQEKQNEVDYLVQAQYLWEEYKYRHDLIWRLVFRFTTAVVLISIIPYIKTSIAACLGWFSVILPLLATGLAILGILVLMNELELFGLIKVKYRQLQNCLFKEPLLHKEPLEKDELNVIKAFLCEIKKLSDLFGGSRESGDETENAEKYSTFRQFVLGYFSLLALLSFANMGYIFFIWRHILPACNLSCNAGCVIQFF